MEGANDHDRGSPAVAVEHLGREQADDRRTASPRGPMAVPVPVATIVPEETVGFTAEDVRHAPAPQAEALAPVVCDRPRSCQCSRALPFRAIDAMITPWIPESYIAWSVPDPRTTIRLNAGSEWRAISDSARSSITGSYPVLPMARSQSRPTTTTARGRKQLGDDHSIDPGPTQC